MYNEGSAEFNALISKAGGNAPITRFKFADFTIERFVKLEYYGGSNNSDDIAIGTTNMAYLDVSTVTDKIITNQEFLFEVGMELSDGTIEYAPMGYFKVQSPDSDEDIVNFKAYDRMQKFEKPYVSSLTYPTDSSQILNELCTMCKVELATPITNPITITDKLDGYTCREVLGYIAGIHGKFACFDRYGKLNLCWYSETPIEKQIGLIWSLTKAQSDYKVEKITLAKDGETTYTSGTGISGINYSNPYGTQAIADSIYTSLGGFTYRPCEISMLDDIRLDPWDMLKVTYLDGSVLTIPAMSLEHSFTSGETRVKSFGKTDTENEYNYSGPVTQAMDRMATELLVVNRVVATKVDAEWVNAHTVTADKLEATNARVEALETNSLTVETADLRYATITNLNAQTARIEDLEATALTADSAIITNLQTDKLNTSDLNAEVAKLGYLTADSADLKYANITFGNIDTANIDVAKIGLLFTKVGLIDRATIVDGHITGFLDAVEINANNITAGTLIADRILLKGSENGLLYALNNLGELTSTEVDTLDGTILTQRTVTADKLVANSITANELDVTNIFGNSAVLTTLTSQQAFINAISTNTVVVGASNTANNANEKAQGIIDNIYTPNTTTIDGGKITTNSIKASSIDVNNLFAQNITATGIITGAKLYGAHVESDSGRIGGWDVTSDKLFKNAEKQYADYIGDYIPFGELGTDAWAQTYWGAGVYITAKSSYFRQGYRVIDEYDDDGNPTKYTEHIGFEANIFGMRTDNFATNSVSSDLISKSTGAPEPLPGGYNNIYYNIGKDTQPWEKLYVREINVVKNDVLGTGGNISAQGDIIAGVGTSNQVSLQTLNSNLTKLSNKVIVADVPTPSDTAEYTNYNSTNSVLLGWLSRNQYGQWYYSNGTNYHTISSGSLGYTIKGANQYTSGVALCRLILYIL